MKIYVSRPIPKNAYKILEDAGIEVEKNEENKILSKNELIKKISDKDGLLSLLTDKIDSEVLDSNSSLKIVSNYAVGYNNIDIEAATSRNILVTNTPGVLSETTADFAFTLLMATARKIVNADKFTREGRFDKWEPLGFLGQDIYNATLGILGAGRIGYEVAKRGHLGFNMRIVYSDVKRNEYFDKEFNATYLSKEELLKQSDFVSLHVPLLPSTKHMISEAELKLMKETAILINTARGPVVDEKALIKALKEGWIWAAGLDVFENEPDISQELLKLENTVLVPHIASASIHTREEMARIAAENIVTFSKGEKPQAMVNPEVIK